MRSALALIVPIALIAGPAQASPPQHLCRVLREFVESVPADAKQAFTFHTIWGGNFKGEAEPVIYAKRCIHDGDTRAEAVCRYLMANGSTEFPGTTAQDAISCLSPGTHFAPPLQLDEGTFSTRHGSDERGALVDITLRPDEALGGMAFRVEAEGY